MTVFLFTGLNNGLKPERESKQGIDMLIPQNKYSQDYALYFAKFIRGCKAEKINIGMAMPQNGFNQALPFCRLHLNSERA